MQRRHLMIGSALALAGCATRTRAPEAVDVDVRAAHFGGRDAIEVMLSAPAQQRILNGQSGGNQPAFAIAADDFGDGALQVDVAAIVNGRGAPDARGFAGLAFHIPSARNVYEAVYLRMTNGRLAQPAPPAPRNERAIQYTAHPDFHFEVSRQRFPGRYERSADIAPGRWHRLRLEIAGPRLVATVDDSPTPALVVDDLRYGGRRGAVGLWVDDGTTAYFAGLQVQRR